MTEIVNLIILFFNNQPTVRFVQMDPQPFIALSA